MLMYAKLKWTLYMDRKYYRVTKQKQSERVFLSLRSAHFTAPPGENRRDGETDSEERRADASIRRRE